MRARAADELRVRGAAVTRAQRTQRCAPRSRAAHRSLDPPDAARARAPRQVTMDGIRTASRLEGETLALSERVRTHTRERSARTPASATLPACGASLGSRLAAAASAERRAEPRAGGGADGGPLSVPPSATLSRAATTPPAGEAPAGSPRRASLGGVARAAAAEHGRPAAAEQKAQQEKQPPAHGAGTVPRRACADVEGVLAEISRHV